MLSLRIFLLLFLVPLTINALEQQDVEENDLEKFDEFSALRDHEIEIPCTFAEAEASRICDCGFKNEVTMIHLN